MTTISFQAIRNSNAEAATGAHLRINSTLHSRPAGRCCAFARGRRGTPATASLAGSSERVEPGRRADLVQNVADRRGALFVGRLVFGRAAQVEANLGRR